MVFPAAGRTQNRVPLAEVAEVGAAAADVFVDAATRGQICGACPHDRWPPQVQVDGVNGGLRLCPH